MAVRSHGERGNEDRLRVLRTAACFAVLLAVLASGSPALSDDAAAEFPQVVRVSKTFNNVPFEYRIESRSQKSGYSIYRVTYPSPVVTPVPQNNTIPAEYYLPDGARPEGPKRPAVICMHILDGDFVLVRMTCSMLASHGIPALMFKLPYYDERGFPEGPRALAADPALFVSALSQGLEDVRRTVDLLASRPEIRADRIGITGISLGGIVAATAAGFEPRLGRAMLILAGGDLRRIIHHAHETDELSALINRLPADEKARIERAIDAVDPLRQAERVRDRARRGKVLMVNAAEDEVIPRPCTEELAAALGISDQVIWLEGLGHYTAMAELPRVLQRTVEFFGEDLPPEVKPAPPTVRARTPVETVASLLHQATRIVLSEPQEGRCHYVDFDLSVTPEGEKTIDARLKLIHGFGWRFKIECNLPWTGEIALGQGSDPWMLSGEKVVFKGTGGPAARASDPLASAEAEHLLKLKMLAGAVAGIAVAPHILNQWIVVSDESPAEGPRTIRVSPKESTGDFIRLVMNDDGKTPRQLTFDVGDVTGTATFRGWQTNTASHDAMFDPPAAAPVKEVDRAIVYRIFSAMFNFAMESAQ